MWVEPEIRDAVVARLTDLTERTSIKINTMLKILDLNKVKFYRWKKRTGCPNKHNGKVPRSHWLTPDEVEKIKDYAKNHYSEGSLYIRDGYRRLTYQMINQNIVAASPSSVYRILKEEGLINRWNTVKKNLKGTGFKQPDHPHKEWHVDF